MIVQPVVEPMDRFAALVCTVCVSPGSERDHDFTADRMMGVDNEW